MQSFKKIGIKLYEELGSQDTVVTELKVTQSALDVHMGCTPFLKD